MVKGGKEGKTERIAGTKEPLTLTLSRRRRRTSRWMKEKKKRKRRTRRKRADEEKADESVTKEGRR